MGWLCCRDGGQCEDVSCRLKRLSRALASCCNRDQLSARSLFNRTWRGVSPPRARNSSRFLSGTCNRQRKLYFSFFRNKCVPSLWVQWIAIIRNRNSWQLTRTPAPGNVFADFGLNKGHCEDFLHSILRIPVSWWPKASILKHASVSWTYPCKLVSK